MGEEETEESMVMTDHDLDIIIPALDVYIDHIEDNLDEAPFLRESLQRAKALKQKILLGEEYD